MMVDVFSRHSPPSVDPPGHAGKDLEERTPNDNEVASGTNSVLTNVARTTNVRSSTTDQSPPSGLKISTKSQHKRSQSVGRHREVKVLVDRERRMEEKVEVEGSKELKNYVADLKKKVGSLETENKDLKSKLDKRLKSKPQEASQVTKQHKTKEQEKMLKTLSEENKSMKKKIKELEKGGGDDGKDIEIQLSELLAENEDLKTKIGRLQQLLGKQSQFSPRYLHHPSKGDLNGRGSNLDGSSPGGGVTDDSHNDEEEEELLPEGGVADRVVLRPRKHGYRQSFRQSIHEKETQLRIRREQSSMRSRVHPFDSTSLGGVTTATTTTVDTPTISDDTADRTTPPALPSSPVVGGEEVTSDVPEDHRLSLSVFFSQLGVNLDNLYEVQERVLQLEDGIIARDEILEEASAELRELREKDLSTSKVLTDLKSRIIDLEGHLAMRDSSMRRLKEELSWKDIEIGRLRDHDTPVPGSLHPSLAHPLASSISNLILTTQQSPEEDGEEELVSMTTLVPSKSPSGSNELGHLRQLISDLSFKLSQLQHHTDTVQREKTAIQKVSLQNERLLRSTIDSYLKEIRFLRQMNFQLGEERAKLEEIPEMMRQIQEMRQSLVEADQLETLQQQIQSLNVTVKEKNCQISELDWQLTSRDYTIGLLQNHRERQGQGPGGGANTSSAGGIDIPGPSGPTGTLLGNGSHDSQHGGGLLSPTSVLTAGDEYQHIRAFPTRPQSAGGSTQKPFMFGPRNRSNSGCRTVIRGDNFSIVMPTENENEEEVLNLEESIDDRQGKIHILGPSVETDDERPHPLQQRIPPPAHHTHHKREEEIMEDPASIARQLKTFGRHRRGASHDSFLSTYSSTSSLQNALLSELGLQPMPTKEDGARGEGDGLGSLIKSLSPSSHADHVTSHNSTSSDVFKMDVDSAEKLPRSVLTLASPGNPTDTPKASTLKRRPPVVKSGPRPPNTVANGYASLGRNIGGFSLEGPKLFAMGSEGSRQLKFIEDGSTRGNMRNASVSSSDNDCSVILSPPGGLLESQVVRNPSFASHGGESSPNSQMSEVPLSGHPPLPYPLPPQAPPLCSSSSDEDDEAGFPKHSAKSGPRYQSRSLENLFDTGSHHLIRRSFRKEFPGYFGAATMTTGLGGMAPAYHKQTPSTDSDPHQRSRTLGPHLRLPQLPSRTVLDPEDIENDALSLCGSEDERLQQLLSLSSRSTIGRVRSASTGSLMIIYDQSSSSVEDLKTLQD